MEKQNVEQIAKEAIDLVDTVDRDYKVEAFRVVFERLLDKHLSEQTEDTTHQRGVVLANKPKVSSGDFAKMIDTPWDYSHYSSLVESGTWVDRAIVVLAAAEEEFGIPSLTPTEVATVLKTQMRVKSVYDSNVSREMGTAKHYLARSKEGKAYRYRLTKAGRDRLNDLLKNNKNGEAN